MHTHILTEQMVRTLHKEAPQLGIRLKAVDEESAAIQVAGESYRPFPRGGWDLARRFQDMEKAGVDVHVLSATTQTYLYDIEPTLAAACAAVQNEEMTALVKAHPDRLWALAALPMQAPELAAAELGRAMRQLGMRGAMIGSNVNGRNLDHPDLEPLWAEAAALNAFLFIHPVQVAGAERMRDYHLRNLIGNPLDTTIAAACLIFSGILERHPALKICLAHGGGFVPYQAGRWLHGWSVREDTRKLLRHSPEPELERLSYDSLLHGKSALEFLVHSVGAGRVLLGSDYPYDMAMLDATRDVRALDIPEIDRTAILGRRAEVLLTTAE